MGGDDESSEIRTHERLAPSADLVASLQLVYRKLRVGIDARTEQRRRIANTARLTIRFNHKY